jgi:hypothetical protein
MSVIEISLLLVNDLNLWIAVRLAILVLSIIQHCMVLLKVFALASITATVVVWNHEVVCTYRVRAICTIEKHLLVMMLLLLIRLLRVLVVLSLSTL